MVACESLDLSPIDQNGFFKHIFPFVAVGPPLARARRSAGRLVLYRSPPEQREGPDSSYLPLSKSLLDHGETYPLVVSCATAPVPPSLLEAAANPLTGAEHVDAGAFEDVTHLYT